MEGGMKCVKFLVFIFNLLFALSGLIILVAGAVIQAGYKEYLEFVPHEVFSAPVILIVAGVVIFVIAFFGCCGAMKENNCMVMTFAVLLAIIFVMEISAGIAAYVLRADVETRIDARMSEALGKYEFDDQSNSIFTSSWNLMQHDLRCCGVKNYTDWQQHPQFPSKGYPPTCCPGIETGTKCTETEPGFYRSGCLKTLTNLIKDNISIVGGVGIGIAFVQLIGIVFACCLAKSIRREYETV